MKKEFRTELFYGVVLPAAGLLGLLLQQKALRTGYDEKNLFVWSNPWSLAGFALCAVYALALILVTRKVAEGGGYDRLFPAGWLRGGLEVLAGVLLAEDLFYSLVPMSVPMRGMGLLAAFSMAAAGVCRGLKKRPLWIFHGLVSLYFVLHLLECYRTWGSSAHLEQYAFPMLAGALLVLFAFHRTEADAGRIRSRKLLLSGYGAMLCCFFSMAGGRSVFYLLAAIWIGAAVCSPVPVRTGRKQ